MYHVGPTKNFFFPPEKAMMKISASFPYGMVASGEPSTKLCRLL